MPAPNKVAWDLSQMSAETFYTAYDGFQQGAADLRQGRESCHQKKTNTAQAGIFTSRQLHSHQLGCKLPSPPF